MATDRGLSRPCPGTRPDAVQPVPAPGLSCRAPGRPGPPLAARLPVARVLVESSLPHLDRPFDYSVPAELDEAAQPGVRVKVKFNGQELSGFIMERAAESDAGHALVPLHKVVSPVACPHARCPGPRSAVAARYAGTVSDVLRVAVPPRVAKLEKEFAAAGGCTPVSGSRLSRHRLAHARPAGHRRSRSSRGQRLGRVPQRRRLPPAPARRRFAAGRAQPAAGLRAGRLAAAARRGRGGRPCLRPGRRGGGSRLPRPGPARGGAGRAPARRRTSPG